MLSAKGVNIHPVHVKHAKGFILVTVLLVTLLLSLIALTMSQTSLMENKMVSYYQSKSWDLVAAENKLLQAENDLFLGKIPREAILIPAGVCGVKFYRINISQKTTVLSSTYAHLEDFSHCDPKPQVKEGRQSFRFF